jgi:hypothetical protein
MYCSNAYLVLIATNIIKLLQDRHTSHEWKNSSTMLGQAHGMTQELWRSMAPKFRTVAMIVTVDTRNILHIHVCRNICDLSKYFA